MKKLPSGILLNLGKQTNLNAKLLSEYVATRKRPGRERARMLKEASGVNEIIWLYGSSTEIKSALMEGGIAGEKTR